ncbi:DUF4328 domain-containing protein [Saccharothrix deserti]|uniref:DUF4328 domain-containing protein n=1 Tax=Saccharothrix deserti TaxID=2593674 RepID=UPI00131C2D56|nr:DUF4328 domain-containing protein [Saccharothrix deserti]
MSTCRSCGVALARQSTPVYQTPPVAQVSPVMPNMPAMPDMAPVEQSPYGAPGYGPPGYEPQGPQGYAPPGYPTAYGPPMPQRWYDVSGLRLVLIVLLGVETVLALLMMVSPLANLGFFLLFIATAVVLVIWLYRARRNAAAGKHQFGPGWEIGGWFIPFAAWYIPVRVVLDIGWAGAPAGRRATVTVPVAVWWAAWVLAVPTGFQQTITETSFYVSFDLGSTWASAACLAVAAAALAFVVHRITVDQERAAAGIVQR